MGDNTKNPLEEIAEAVMQYTLHQPFLLSALTNEEELKSRVAFVDTYRSEFESLHRILKNIYNLYNNHSNKENDKFAYLRDSTFRQNAERIGLSFWGLTEDAKVYLDMMKDYLTYRRVHGDVNDTYYETCFHVETTAEQSFRTQAIIQDPKKWDFLIDPPDSDPSNSHKPNTTNPVAKKRIDKHRKGLRECRKWMYRNCPKSGIFNDTGSKRNYIDAFVKKPLGVQLDTLYLIEKKLYSSTKLENTPMNYVPNLEKLKKTMLYSNIKYINPLHLYRKLTGNSIKWPRMEQALKKAEEQVNRRTMSITPERTRSKSMLITPTAAHRKAMLLTTPKLAHSKTIVTTKPKTPRLIESKVITTSLNVHSCASTAVSSGKFIYSLAGGSENGTLNVLQTGLGATSIGTSAIIAAYSGVKSVQCINGEEKAAKIKEMSREKSSFLPDESRNIYDMAKVSKTKNGAMARYYAVNIGSHTVWLGVGVPAFLGIGTAILGPVGAVISLIGAGASYAVGYFANKRTAEKCVISAMKTQELQDGKLKPKNGKYINGKITQHQELLEEKINRFYPGETGRQILAEHIKSPQKMKARVLENWAVQHGYPTIYRARDRLDHEKIVTALQFVLLKNPSKPVSKDNLLTEEDHAQYFSEDQADSNLAQMARTRIAYKTLLETRKIDVTPPKDVEDAKKRLGLQI